MKGVQFGVDEKVEKTAVPATAEREHYAAVARREGWVMRSRRRLLIALVGLAFVALVGLAVITVPAFIRAPKLVAQLDVAGALPFAPTALPGSRICALLSVQDPTFYRHQGIGLLDGAPGHTTVTQALCKRLYFKEFSPGLLRLGKIKP